MPIKAGEAKARSNPRNDGHPNRERASSRVGRRGGGGRPTLEDSVRRDVRLLQVATSLFMERGFDGTSIDAVAEAAGVSKLTVYARYHDKRDLFAAVLRGRIARWLAPLSAAAEAQANEARPKNISKALHELSRQMITQALMPEWATLQRILSAQAIQFPELAKLAHEEGWLRAVRGVATLLRQFAVRDEIKVADPELAAEMFFNLVLGHSKRLALYGMPVDLKTEERHRHAGVELFLSALKAR